MIGEPVHHLPGVEAVIAGKRDRIVRRNAGLGARGLASGESISEGGADAHGVWPLPGYRAETDAAAGSLSGRTGYRARRAPDRLRAGRRGLGLREKQGRRGFLNDLAGKRWTFSHRGPRG